MRLGHFFMLMFAAGAGTLVYQCQRSDYEGLTGSGSLMESLRTAKSQQGGAGRASRNGDATALQVIPDDVALLDAAAKGSAAKVEQRISARAKIDSRDSLRRTPLMYASWNGHEDVIERLLAAGANPELQDRQGNNAVDYAAGRGLVGTVEFLLKHTHAEDNRHYVEYATLIQAAYAGDASKLPEGKLASVNRINPEGQSPLHIVAGNGSLAVAAALLAEGAQVNSTNGDRQTPLHWAVWNNQPKMIAWLLAHGAEIDRRDAGGNTALILAAQNHSREAVRILAEKGADKDIANKQGKTASIIAEDKGYQDLEQWLK